MSKVFRIFLIVLLGFMAIAFGFQNLSIYSNRFTDAVKEYPANGSFFSLQGMKEENDVLVEAKLYEYANKYEAVITRRDVILSSFENGGEGYKFGVYGNVDKQLEHLLLEFNGLPILDGEKLSLLLNSAPESTLGLDKNSADMLEDIPYLRYSSKIVAMQLPQMIKDSGTLRGDYKIVGLSAEEFNDFLSELSALSGIEKELLLNPLSGSATSPSILDIFSLAALLASVVFIAITAFLAVFLNIRQYGIHAMLGWSKWAYVGKVNLSPIAASLVFSAIPAGIAVWGFHGYPFTFQLIVVMILAVLKFLFFAALALSPAAIALVLIKPVKAIRNQVSRRSLLGLCLLLFIASSAGFTGALRALDGPLYELKNANEVQAQWEKYLNYKILHKDFPGDNVANFSGGQSNEHFREVYSWYRAIENQPGVYLVHNTFYSSEVLNAWRGIYKETPKKPFWHMAASPSYLESIDFYIPHEDKKLAQAGARIYYIPDTYTEEERLALSAWLEESDMKDRGKSIVTPFMEDPKIEFRQYTPSDKIFMWNTNPENDFFAKDPVIYVATAANMTPFESESLNATGLEHSYIKLTSQAAEKYTAESFLARYSLDDNAFEFLSVSEYIAGIRKSMTEFIQIFGGMAAFVILLDVALLFILLSLYAQIYSQQVAVKRLLGYPLRLIFSVPFIFVTVVCALCILASFALGSRVGLVITAIFMVVQLFLMVWQAKRLASKQISINVKEQ